MIDRASIQTELNKIEKALVALREALSGPALEAALASLLEKQQRYEAQLEGAGALAQGQKATAVGERGVAARDVHGPIITGDHATLNPDPAQAAAERARKRYLKRLHQQCNVLPLTAMGGEEGVGDEVTLEQVYVALDTQTRVSLTEEERAQRKDQEQLRLFSDEERSIIALEATTQERRLVLLGAPGSGKSTFVSQLAARVSEAYLDHEAPYPEWETGLLPLLITLCELAPHLAALELAGLSEVAVERRLVEIVREFLTAQLRAYKAEAWDAGLDDVLLAGKVLLIFDGLDEVAEVCRERVRRAVGALLRTYGQLQRVIVTCRVRAYTGAAVLPGFTSYTLAPFDEKQVRAFVVGWYRVQYRLGRLRETLAEERARDLQRAVLSDDLRELARNPMLLTTMALIHQREVGLPRERVRLYSLAVQVLLTRWQQRKGVVASSELAMILGDDLQLRVFLERLAYEAHQGQAERSRAAAGLSRKDLLAILEEPAYLGDVGLAAEFLDYVDRRAGLLVGQGGEVGGLPKTYTFPHRTFQEYLAGCYLVGAWDSLALYWQRAGEGDAWYLAAVLGAEELRYNRRSVKDLLHLAYDLVPEEQPTSEQAWRAVLWSGQMATLFSVEEIRRVMQPPKSGTKYLERLVPRLVGILRQAPLGARQAPLGAVERVEAGKALAKLGDPRPGVDRRADGLPDIVWCAVPAGPFLMGSAEADDQGDADEKPQHTYEIQQPYAISRYPITNAQFAAFVAAGGYREVRYWTQSARADVWREGRVQASYDDAAREGPYDYAEPFYLPNHPVVGVTWYEALAFCRWLTEELQRKGELTGSQIITLPTEAQWEKAARGSDGRRYPWGEEVDPQRANYGDTGIGTTSAVGAFPGGASPYGVEDLSGNVWEWCRTRWEDNYNRYRSDDTLEGDAVRVLRGGSFGNIGSNVRCACRYRYFPFDRYNHLGFRVIISFLPRR